MKQIRIVHQTEYHYYVPVKLGPHGAMLRPREGHDVHIQSARLEIEPQHQVLWLRDIYGNSIAVITFLEPTTKLRLLSELTVALYDDHPIECLLEPSASSYPFQYSAEEQIEIVPYRIPSYPHDGVAVQKWLSDLYQPGRLIGTWELLAKLNTRIFESFQYRYRPEYGVQLPCTTLALGSGSCRDYAVFMMEAARHWGFAARFVTGYIQMAEGQHGATHAWTEIYLPGAGWHGYDPTNNKLVGAEHVSVGVAREQDKASPLSGMWEGPADAFQRMDVSVQVVSI
jgi:transglutaminase-like putative cysteine protease